MATYPIKMMIDESGQPFVPLTSLDAVIGEKNLQYIIDATETSAGHFNIIIKDVTLDKLKNTAVVVRWPQISSTVKPSYLQLNEEEEIILYNGLGTEYLDLENASNTVNILACDGEKWILTSGAGSGSGSGHIITDENGNTMAQQQVLNFVGFNVENDAANRATKIVNPTPINNLTTTETGVGSLDAYQGHVLASRTIPSGGESGQVLAKSNNIDYQVEWVDRSSSDTVPIGTLQPFLGLMPPKGYLACQGQLVSKTTYSKLYEICGDTFGTSTETHFYLPDLRGKTIAGYDENNAAMNVIGKLLGTDEHRHETYNHTLTIDEMPAHYHEVTALNKSDAGPLAYNDNPNALVVINYSTSAGGVFPIKTNGWSNEVAILNAGRSQPHNHGDTGLASNYQPTITVNWIVKAVMLIPDYIIVEDTLNSDSAVDALSARQGKLLNEKFADLEGTIVFEGQGSANWLSQDTTYSFDVSQYKYLLVHFTSAGVANPTSRDSGNAVSQVVHIDLTTPTEYPICNVDGVYYRYGGTEMHLDMQFLFGNNADPGMFFSGLFVSEDKKKIYVGNAGYVVLGTSGPTVQWGALYNGVSRIVGFK